MLTVDSVDRAPTVRRYGRCGHVCAAVLCENALHTLTGDRRRDHRERRDAMNLRGGEGVKAGSIFVFLTYKLCGALICGLHYPYEGLK